MTQGKIERWHQTLKNRILLENYYLPGDLERRIEAFVDHYNHRATTRASAIVTPADAYFGRASDHHANNEKGSSKRPSNTDACFTKLTQPNIKPDAPESSLD